MKNLKFLIVILTGLLISSTVLKAQEPQVIVNDTIGNSGNVTGAITFEPNRIIDSVVFVVYAKGEIDLDRFIVTRGVSVGDWVQNYTTSVGDTTTLTIDNDSTTATITKVKNHTGITGCNKLKVQVDAGSSGNDATDPNNVKVIAIPYYRQRF
ncbi:MAG: hypothetical protein UZ05_CHB002000267 [Chlorobi bacterium OLB5]|nr:MAG: hypothetical protein UZ05_CHB002000267 [Chlorobi bacterium OLB5]